MRAIADGGNGDKEGVVVSMNRVTIARPIMGQLKGTKCPLVTCGTRRDTRLALRPPQATRGFARLHAVTPEFR